jgi:hypothetical protein
MSARRRGVQSELERIEVEALPSGDHDLAIDDASGRRRAR